VFLLEVLILSRHNGFMQKAVNQESNAARMRRSMARSPKVPRITKTVGLSDYLERKSRIQSKVNKWQWLVVLAMAVIVPFSAVVVQKQWFDRVSGSEGETLTAVLTPYDVDMVDQTTFSVLVHLPLANMNFVKGRGEYLLNFDPRFLQIVSAPDNLALGVSVSDWNEANETGELVFDVDIDSNNLVANRLAKVTFAPRVRIDSVTKITFAPESKVVLDNTKTYLVKGNSATVRILDGYGN